MRGTVYTETLVYAAPAAFVKEAPYQIVIVTLENGSRVTGRVDGERLAIGDPVESNDLRNGVPFFRREGSPAHGRQANPEEKVLPQETI